MSDYLVYGSVGWDAPWLTEHNLSHALSARGNRVLFVEPPISLAAPARQLRGGISKLLRRKLRSHGDVAVLQPVAIPPVSSRRAQAVGGPLRRLQVGKALAQLRMRSPVTISTRDVVKVHAFDDALRVYLVKDWIQAGGELLGRSDDALAAEVAEMARWADVVCAISPQLQQGLRGEGIESVVLRHGFHADLAHRYEDTTVPRDLRALPRPLLGYAGRIDSRLDVELLLRLADRFARATVVLLGPISPRFPEPELERLAEKPNIALIGPRPREELPPYLTAFDCALMPYRRSEWAEYGSPLKLWDLLYAGPPIVGSGYLSLRAYAPAYLSFADDAGEFLDAVEVALQPERDGVERRRRYALENSWMSRAAELEQLVERTTSERRDASWLPNSH